MQLDIRAQTLLKALVERYIADGQPVGSRALAKISGLELSPATIRNIMSDLEEMGFVSSPHTSAGRIPTPRGYRIFVDTLLTVRTLQTSPHWSRSYICACIPIRRTRSFPTRRNVLSYAVAICRSRIDAAPRVGIPANRISAAVGKAHPASHRHPQRRSPKSPAVDRPDYTPSQLIQAANYINQHFGGLSFDDVRIRLQAELRQLRDDMTRLMQAAVEAGSDAMADTGETW